MHSHGNLAMGFVEVRESERGRQGGQGGLRGDLEGRDRDRQGGEQSVKHGNSQQSMGREGQDRKVKGGKKYTEKEGGSQ